MLMGIRLQAHPTEQQKLILSQWMGCARFVWNAKCDEDKYFTTFARKFFPIKTYAPVDQTYSHFKDKDLSPWLLQCPSQILRNSTANWFDTYQKFRRGECGKPKRKKKTDGGSVHLTRELFRFEICSDGVTRLLIGTVSRNIGYLTIKNHRRYKLPNSIYIKKKNGNYWVAFCYDDAVDETTLLTQKAHLAKLRQISEEYLHSRVVGVDRGIVRPVQAGHASYDFSPQQKQSKKGKEIAIRRYQRKMARQKKNSEQRRKTKERLAKNHQKIANIRKDFCHQTSRSLVNREDAQVIVFEDLRTKNMIKRPKAKQVIDGHWEKNGAKAKAGLNKAILDKGWHLLELFTKYKALRANKAFFKISASYTSQECAACSHIHPDNRKKQDVFICESCGHTDNADHNAAEVIKKRAIKLLRNSGTELSERGVLFDSGCGAIVRRGKRKQLAQVAKKHQKRREQQQCLVLEASPLQG